MRFLVRFVEIKVKNGLTWFLIYFSKKKKYEIWTYLLFFMYFCIKVNQIWKNI